MISFRAADVVRHMPSGETWVLAVDSEGGRVMPCGWPESMASTADCELVKPASEAARLAMLHTWAMKFRAGESDGRARAAVRQLEVAK